jgi:hypothetical protein
LSEGQEIYAQMVEARTQRDQIRMPDSTMGGAEGLAQLLRDGARSNLLDEIRSGREDEHRRSAPQRSLRQRWGEWWNTFCAMRAHRMVSNVATREAQERGACLLRDNLTPTQRGQYAKSGYFEVSGGESGTRYRIRHGSQMNVERLDARGRRACVLCFVPEGRLVIGDIMLAQKIALELFESEAIAVANTMPMQLRAIA